MVKPFGGADEVKMSELAQSVMKNAKEEDKRRIVELTKRFEKTKAAKSAATRAS
jgi:hypothetical protein